MPFRHVFLRLLSVVTLLFVVSGFTPEGTVPEALASTVPSGFADQAFTTLGSPTAIAFTPDPDVHLIALQQSGQAQVYHLDGTLVTQAVDVSSEICAQWERGLLGIAIDPDFNNNHFVYLFANFGGCDSNNDGRVVRYTVNNDMTFGSRVTIIDNIPSLAGNHNGGDIHFGKDGKLYISVGDGGTGGGAAPDKSTLGGKILRINPDGTPPSDNPFFSEGGSQRCGDADGDTGSGTCQEIYAYGLRNPFRIAMDPNAAGTRFFINDVGQSTWEEIDENVSGANYGWNVREGPCPNGQACTPNLPTGGGYTDPIHWYGRSVGSSITGGAFVPNGIGWPAEFTSAYLFADYATGTIFRLNRTSQTGTNQYTRSNFVTALGSSSATSLTFGPSSTGGTALYYTTYAGGGEIRMVEYTDNSAPAASFTASPASGPVPLTVNFDASASTGLAPLTYAWAFGDGATGTGVTAQHTYSQQGVYTVTLTVTNGVGNSNTQKTIQAGTPPVVTISLPTPGTTFSVGQSISMQGSATSGGSPLPAAALSWVVLLHHVDENSPQNSHTHPFANRNGVSSATFTAPAPEDLYASAMSYVEVRLTATDSLGLTTTVTREVQPKRVTLTFNTSPGNLIVNVADTVSPHAINNGSVIGWTGWTLTATVPRLQSTGGQLYVFSSWADGQTASPRTINVGATDATYTARFVRASLVYLPVIRHP